MKKNITESEHITVWNVSPGLAETRGGGGGGGGGGLANRDLQDGCI